MTLTLEGSVTTRTRDPKVLLNGVESHLQHLTTNVLDSGMTIWVRRLEDPGQGPNRVVL